MKEMKLWMLATLLTIGGASVFTACKDGDDNSGTNGKWYTIGGLQLQQKPTHKGVYIFNGKKVMVK